MAIYSVERQVQDIDDSLLELVDTNLKYVSYKHTISAECLTSIHANKSKNVKACYKTIMDINIDNFVTY